VPLLYLSTALIIANDSSDLAGLSITSKAAPVQTLSVENVGTNKVVDGAAAVATTSATKATKATKGVKTTSVAAAASATTTAATAKNNNKNNNNQQKRAFRFARWIGEESA
jgi:hypothetical protein